METPLINLHDTGGRVPEGAVRIDRKTRWGNPYPITAEAPREEVIRRYKAFLWGRIRSGAISEGDLAALHGKRLACWCHPRACHGEVLVAAAAWAHRQLQAQPEAEPTASP